MSALMLTMSSQTSTFVFLCRALTPFSLAVTGKQLMCIQPMSCVYSQPIVVVHTDCGLLSLLSRGNNTAEQIVIKVLRKHTVAGSFPGYIWLSFNSVDSKHRL